MIKQIKGNYWVELFHSVAFWMLFLAQTSGQNLIANESFETISTDAMNDCSIRLGYSERLVSWQGLNTVDFIHQEYPFSQRSGHQKISPNHGRGMAGLYLADAGDGSLPEFLYQKLAVNIKSGVTYRINFFLHFRYIDGYFPTKIGLALFDKDPCGVPWSEMILQKSIDINLPDSVLTEDHWIHLSKEFIAHKDGLYVGFGSFEKKAGLVKKKSKTAYSGVYVFMDDISLVPIERTILPDNIAPISSVADTISEPQVNTQLLEPTPPSLIAQQMDLMSAMPTISFEHNSSELNQFYQSILSDLAPKLLQENCQVLISGHTDNSGDDSNNQRLSRMRAQAVADFLIQQGLTKAQIEVQGFGSQKPIASGDDVFSKSMNRRVDIVKLCD